MVGNRTDLLKKLDDAMKNNAQTKDTAEQEDKPEAKVSAPVKRVRKKKEPSSSAAQYEDERKEKTPVDEKESSSSAEVMAVDEVAPNATPSSTTEVGYKRIFLSLLPEEEEVLQQTPKKCKSVEPAIPIKFTPSIFDRIDFERYPHKLIGTVCQINTYTGYNLTIY